jgi:hypothetical protein
LPERAIGGFERVIDSTGRGLLAANFWPSSCCYCLVFASRRDRVQGIAALLLQIAASNVGMLASNKGLDFQEFEIQ